MELMHEGVVGLLRTLERYDPALGTPFWMYASWWVRQAMQQLVFELGRPIVLGGRAQAARAGGARRWRPGGRHDARRAARRSARRGGLRARAAELGEELGVSAERVRQIEEASLTKMRGCADRLTGLVSRPERAGAARGAVAAA
ncbi:MAG: sigma factor, partial [Solirubrobacteraceae bacterium]